MNKFLTDRSTPGVTPLSYLNYPSQTIDQNKPIMFAYEVWPIFFTPLPWFIFLGSHATLPIAEPNLLLTPQYLEKSL